MAALKGYATVGFLEREAGSWGANLMRRGWEGQKGHAPTNGVMAALKGYATGGGGGRCDARCGSWGDFWCGSKFLFRLGLRGWREILCRKQVDHLGASGEAAELDIDAGIGQRQDGFIELVRKGSRVAAERQELEQFGGGAGPVGRAIQEGADGIDEWVGRGRSVEGGE